MTRVVVTGGHGFLGSHLVDELVRTGHEVVVFDAADRDSPYLNPRAHYVVGDIRDPSQLGEVITPDVATVYHFAAMVGVDHYIERPVEVIDTNFLGTRNVLECAAASKTKVVLASTSEIFGKNPDVPWSEDADRVLGSTAIDRWCYSSSKALGEHLAFAFVRERGLQCSVVRFFNVYGPRQRPSFVVSRNIHRALNGRQPRVYDGGDQTRCFTYVGDAIAATVAVGTSEAAIGECFNVGSSAETTVAQVCELIAQVVGDCSVQSVETRDADRYQDLRRRAPDTTKIRELLDWRCTTDLRDGIAMTVSWARATPGWLAQQDRGVA